MVKSYSNLNFSVIHGVKKEMNCIIKMILNVIIHHAYLKKIKETFREELQNI